mmetsp:Transcript_152047/g.291053  ORF Transcript_152047/g.291053 Transcript_152047/m.291053 type:complete len:635 (-) Transcript_152047:165-2069(-)
MQSSNGLLTDSDQVSCGEENHIDSAHPTPDTRRHGTWRNGTLQQSWRTCNLPLSGMPCWSSTELGEALEAHQHVLLQRLEQWILVQEGRQKTILSNVLSSRGSFDTERTDLSEVWSRLYEAEASQVLMSEVCEQKALTCQSDFVNVVAVATNAEGSPRNDKKRKDTSGQSFQRYTSLQEVREKDLVNVGTVPLVTKSMSIRKQVQSVSAKIKKMTRSSWFEIFFACMIGSNAVLLGVEVIVSASANVNSMTFSLIQVIFTAIFLMELLLRLVGGNGCRQFFLHSETQAWNIFDTIVVLCSLVETMIHFVLLKGEDPHSDSLSRWVRMARVARLARVLRIMRIVRFVGPLRVLVVSIASTLRTLCWAMLLLLIIIYVFAVLIAQATADHFKQGSSDSFIQDKNTELDRYWGSLPVAMYTLFMSISGGVNWITVIEPLDKLGLLWGVLFIFFIVFSSFAVLNVMTGVFCESAIRSAQNNYEVKVQAVMSDRQRYISKLKSLFEQIDMNGSGELELEALHHLWCEESMRAFFTSLELEPNDCWMFFTILASHCESGVKIEEFVDGCMKLKGTAKAFDVAVISLELKHLSSQLIDFMNTVEDKLNKLSYLFRDEPKSQPHRRRTQRSKTVTVVKCEPM